MSWKSNLRRYLIWILPLFISIAVVQTCFYLAEQLNIWNANAIEQAFQKSKYYEHCYDDLDREIDSIISQTTIPKTVITDILTMQKCYFQITTNIHDISKGNEVQTEDKEFEAELEKNLADYIVEQGIQLENESDTIRQIVKTVMNAYQKTVRAEVVEYIYEYQKQYKATMLQREIVLSVIGILSILLLYLLRVHKEYILRDVACGLFGGSLISIIAGSMVRHKLIGKYTEVTFYQDFIHIYLKNWFQCLCYMIGVWVMLAFALLILQNMIRKKSRRS